MPRVLPDAPFGGYKQSGVGLRVEPSFGNRFPEVEVFICRGGCGSILKHQESDRRFESMVPFTRAAHFGHLFLTHSPVYLSPVPYRWSSRNEGNAREWGTMGLEEYLVTKTIAGKPPSKL